jgi:hypothetical protein
MDKPGAPRAETEHAPEREWTCEELRAAYDLLAEDPEECSVEYAFEAQREALEEAERGGDGERNSGSGSERCAP